MELDEDYKETYIIYKHDDKDKEEGNYKVESCKHIHSICHVRRCFGHQFLSYSNHLQFPRREPI